MVQNTIGRNIANLQDLGDVSYDLARPILRQVTNPEQLRSLELASPQIAANDAEIWRTFIRRDIPNWRSKIPDPNNISIFCYDVYCKLKDKEQREIEAQENQLRQALTQLDKKKEANKSHLLQKVVQLDGLPDHNPNQPNLFASNRRHAAPAPSLRNAKDGTQIIRALRQQSRQAGQPKKFNKPFGATPIALPSTKSTGVTITMTKYKGGESKGERSLRLALEAEQREKAMARGSRREVKKIVRKERAQEASDQAKTAPAQPSVPAPTQAHTSPPAPTQAHTSPPSAPQAHTPRRPSIHSTPPRTTPPQSAYLSPPPNPHLPRPREMKHTPPRRTPSPFKKSAMPNSTPPQDTSPAELSRTLKSESPVPAITLNDEGKPKIPVYVLPAAQRRGPVSIFAPKAKPRRRV
jgi:elongin-A